MTTPAILLRDVTKRYEAFALGPLQLTLPAGLALGLQGPNGSGKSTLFRLLANLVRRDGGQIEVCGHSVEANRWEFKEDLALVSEDLGLYPAASIQWHLDLGRSFYSAWDATRAEDYLRRFELSPHQPTRGLSRGQRLKLLFTLALAHRPKVLLLDEATAGLDEASRIEMRRHLRQLVQAEGLTVLISSHLREDIELVADEVMCIEQGKLVHAEVAA